MPSTRDLLQRFRPAGAPGAATATGVPADRSEERAAELAGVFAVLEATVAEAERVRQSVRARAQEIRNSAREQALATVAQARLDAETLRTLAVAEARDTIVSARQHNVDEAVGQSREIEIEATPTLDQDVVQVVATVRRLLLESGRVEGSR